MMLLLGGAASRRHPRRCVQVATATLAAPASALGLRRGSLVVCQWRLRLATGVLAAQGSRSGALFRRACLAPRGRVLGDGGEQVGAHRSSGRCGSQALERRLRTVVRSVCIGREGGGSGCPVAVTPHFL
jgi:hypothetical protein